MSDLRILFLVIALAAVTGCSGGDAGPDAACSFDLEWGPEAETFVPFANGDTAEITLGFQGFRYVRSVARLEGSTADMVRTQFQIDVEGHDAYSQPGAEVPTRPGNGAQYQDELLVFFNDIPLPELVGREARIVAQSSAAGCSADYDVTVTLVDEDDTVEQE
jgi:hypothetical protein